MHAKAKAAPEQDWIVVAWMHEPIISRELWDIVQAQISANARPIDFKGNVSMFAGLLTCGDCGRSMSKTTWNGRVTYSCGSYHRYGRSVCIKVKMTAEKNKLRFLQALRLWSSRSVRT